MIEGKTKSGFKYSIDERRLNDWTVFESMADMTSGEPNRILQGTVNFVNFVMGEDKNDLILFIRKKNKGYCDQAKVQEMVTEIVESVRELKNSSSSQG